jgi:RNA recognition motif-containing protein
MIDESSTSDALGTGTHGRHLHGECNRRRGEMNQAKLASQWSAPVSLRRLHVGNLSRFTSERELRAFCAGYGPLQSVTLVLQPRTLGKARLFGFVEYQTEEAAKHGLLAINGAMLHGHMLSVSVASHRTSETKDRGGT